MSRRTIQVFCTSDEVAFITTLPREAFDRYALLVLNGSRQYDENIDRPHIVKTVEQMRSIYAAMDRMAATEKAS